MLVVGLNGNLPSLTIGQEAGTRSMIFLSTHSKDATIKTKTKHLYTRHTQQDQFVKRRLLLQDYPNEKKGWVHLTNVKKLTADYPSVGKWGNIKLALPLAILTNPPSFCFSNHFRRATIVDSTASARQMQIPTPPKRSLLQFAPHVEISHLHSAFSRR